MAIDISDLEVPTTQQPAQQSIDISDLEVPQTPSGSYPLNPLRVAGAVANTVSNLAPWNKVSKVFPYVAGKEAELYGRMGVPAPISASLTTPLAIAPQITGTALGLQGIYNAESPLVKGLVNTPEELGPEYEAQNEAAGVTRRVPQEGGSKPTFAPPENLALTKQPKPLAGGEAVPLPSTMPIRYPSRPADFISYANGRLQGNPSQLNPQELLDWQVKLQTDMSNGNIPRIDPTTGRTTTIFQQASDLMSRTRDQFNQLIDPLLQNADLPEGVAPTRQSLNDAARISYGQQNFQNALKKGGTLARYGAEGLGGLAAIYAAAKKALSQGTP